ncbi:MAG: hypothetical protein ACOWWO_04495 [Peptococcaceae bacterium]
MLVKIAYGLLFIGVILKSYGLFYLTGKKDIPFKQKQKKYLIFNWPGNILLAGGIIILLLK